MESTVFYSGLAYFGVSVEGTGMDLHSGVFGGSV
jgi:hypothetical protein